MTGPVVFRDLPRESYPFTAEWISETTGEVVHVEHVSGPGVLMVPVLYPVHGPCAVRISYADGNVVECTSDGTVRSRGD